MTPTVQIEVSEYHKLSNLAELSKQQIERMAENRAKELLEEFKPKVEVTIYMKNDIFDSFYEDKCGISVVPNWSVEEQLMPLANKVRYWVYDTLSEAYHTRLSRYSDNKKADFLEAKCHTQSIYICGLFILAAILLAIVII